MWISRASSAPEMTRTSMPVRSRTAARKSPPFSASRVALVAAAMISSTLCESASRRNLDSASRPPAIAAGVSARPSRPPAPSRTISFSRSMISKDRSGRTWATIMCTELVPMSIAARRMGAHSTMCRRASRHDSDLDRAARAAARPSRRPPAPTTGRRWRRASAGASTRCAEHLQARSTATSARSTRRASRPAGCARSCRSSIDTQSGRGERLRRRLKRLTARARAGARARRRPRCC